MAKLNLTLPVGELPVTGKQVSFVAPCNSDGLTHVIVGDIEFELVDSNGNNIIDGAFAEGVMVSVILDVESVKAYIQNADISYRLKNSFVGRFSFNASAEERYAIFAQLFHSNEDTNTGATLLVTDCGSNTSPITGSWLVQLSNRGSKPTMKVTTLQPHDGGTVEFGYYKEGDYYYFGVHTSANCADRIVTVFRDQDTVTDGIEIVSDETSAPEEWTPVEAIEYAVDLADLGVTATATEINYLKGVKSNVQTQLDAKANKADIAKTVYAGTTSGSDTYFKISNFGNWGTGNWYEKGFSMLISSRAGEMIWVSVASNDSNTSAGAFRLINRYEKIKAVYYNNADSSIYVVMAAWSNNICAHLLTNLNGDYVPTVASVTEVPSDAVAIPIVEFGVTNNSAVVGDSSVLLKFGGSGDRPTYNDKELALKTDVVTYGNATSASAGLMSPTDKANLDSLVAKAISVLSGSAEPTSAVGKDGDIYIVTG